MRYGVFVLLLIFNSTAQSAENRWSSSERHLAALEIRRLSLGLTPLIQNRNFDRGSMSDFLHNAINSDTHIDARRGGQMLFLSAIADKSAMFKTLEILKNSNIGGIGSITAASLAEVHTAMNRDSTGIQHLQSAAAVRLKKLTPHWWRKLNLGRKLETYRNLLFDGGRVAEFDGPALVELSGREQPAINHYGFANGQRDFGLLQTASLVAPEKVHQLSQTLRGDFQDPLSNNGELATWETRLLESGPMMWKTDNKEILGFDSIGELARNIIMQLRSFGLVPTPCSWICSFCYRESSRKADDSLHLDEDYMRILLTFFGASTYYVHGSTVHEAPVGDALAMKASVLHAAPRYKAPRLFLLIRAKNKD